MALLGLHRQALASPKADVSAAEANVQPEPKNSGIIFMIDTVKQINDTLKGEPLIVMFSTGKDSIVMADLLIKGYSGKKEFVFLYFVEGLEIKQRLIDYYEKRWNIKIHQQPDSQVLSMKTGKKYKPADIEKGLRAKFNISYIAQGVRRDESMARRGMLAHLPYGIDERNKKLYPIADFSTKDVMSYIKLNKLMLPVEYSHGWIHDFYVPDVNGLIYLKNNYPKDYQKVTAEFPQLKAMVFGKEN
jgi:3'-phosphoadenosine 5'-phosphosulfate sulfotransferase (PAPS reductase)/FAD synthetase